jgi:tetratricopeptide (TPR) repeat protein
MLKNLLKTSVSVFVLFGILSSIDPSYGMDDEENKKSVNKVPSPKTPIEWILAPLGDFTKRPLAKLDLKSISTEDTFSKMPKSIRIYILSFLDPQSTRAAAGACKSLYKLISDRQEDLQKNWNKKNITPEYLRQFFSHPLNVLWILKTLAPDFPYQPLNIRTVPDSNIITKGHSHPATQLLENLTTAIRNFPECHHFLCRAIMTPLPFENFQEVGLVSHIIKEVPALQKIFQKILENTNSLSPILRVKALKLLALSGDKEAEKHMGEFINFCEQDEFDQQLFTKTENYSMDLKNFLGAFSDDKVLIESAMNNFQDIVNIDRRYYCIYLDSPCISLNELEKFAKYAFALFPKTEEIQHVFFKNTSFLISLKGKPLRPEAFLKYLNENTSSEPKTLEDYIEKAKKHSQYRLYKKAAEILEEAIPHVQEPSDRFKIIHKIVRNLLKSGDQEKIKDIEKYLEVLIKTDNQNICLSKLYLTQAAYHILKKEFDKAYNVLETAYKENKDQKINIILKVFHNLIESEIQLEETEDKLCQEFAKKVWENKNILEKIKIAVENNPTEYNIFNGFFGLNL